MIEGDLEVQKDTEEQRVHDITEESEQNWINRERYTDRIVEVEHTEEGKETLRRDHLQRERPQSRGQEEEEQRRRKRRDEGRDQTAQRWTRGEVVVSMMMRGGAKMEGTGSEFWGRGSKRQTQKPGWTRLRSGKEGREEKEVNGKLG